jgi:hypothetical protein
MKSQKKNIPLYPVHTCQGEMPKGLANTPAGTILELLYYDMCFAWPRLSILACMAY